MEIKSFLFFLCTLWTVGEGFSQFRDRIPNGNRVPNPLDPTKTWIGVGHFNPQGGGINNHFGLDFNILGKVWSKELCNKDSDGDGMTNGQELGDPDCSWVEGMPDPEVSQISHPGLCDPWTSEKCTEAIREFNITLGPFNCPEIRKEGVTTVKYPVPPIVVPKGQEIWSCVIVNIPDGNVMALGLTNSSVFHHFTSSLCDDTEDLSMYGTDKHFQCRMALFLEEKCVDFYLAIPTHIHHNCVGEQHANNMKASGKSRMVLDFHFYNTFDYDVTEYPIVEFYMAPNPGESAIGSFIVQSIDFVVPKGNPSFQEVAYCDNKAYRYLIQNNTINIVSFLGHTHTLGTRVTVDHFRNGKFVSTLFDAKRVTEISSLSIKLSEPYVVNPGDELKVTCTFNSSNEMFPRFFGESSNDEMCMAMLYYYPKHDLYWPVCSVHHNITTPNFWGDRSIFPSYQGCDMVSFLDVRSLETQQMIGQVLMTCRPEYCNKDCYTLLKALKRHPCLQGSVGAYALMKILTIPNGINIVAAFRSCDAELEKDQIYQEFVYGIGQANMVVLTKPVFLLAFLVAMGTKQVAFG